MSNEINNGGSAFPEHVIWCNIGGEIVEENKTFGMSLRDYFAAKALSALLANDFKPQVGNPPMSPTEYVKELKNACKSLCRDSYWFADEMLIAREAK